MSFSHYLQNNGWGIVYDDIGHHNQLDDKRSLPDTPPNIGAHENCLDRIPSS